jgi:hypothetical protein
MAHTTAPIFSDPDDATTETHENVVRPRSALRSAQVGVQLVTAVLLGVVAVMMFMIASHNQSDVNSQLAWQGLRFPPAGSPQFAPAQFPSVQKYAGDLVNTGPRAEAYANGFITPELRLATSGLTPGQVASAAANDPTNAALQAEAASVFEAATTRQLLLSAWTVSQFATDFMYLGYALALGFVLMILASIMSSLRTRSSRVVAATRTEIAHSQKPLVPSFRVPSGA